MKHLRAYLIGSGIGVFALAALPLTGVFDHRATSASPLTGWYSWMAQRQSVTLRSISVLPPDLSDPSRAARAAGHYQLVCAACHGAPGVRPLLFTEALSPKPPVLALADRWRPAARLYQTVKYGLHNSAMPAWATQKRDDEIWDMVAFLKKLPELDAASYEQMAGSARCQDCHGDDGKGRDGIPRLDLQTPSYIAAALRDYQAGVRASGTMMAVARRLTEADITRYAEDFGLARVVPADAAKPGESSVPEPPPSVAPTDAASVPTATEQGRAPAADHDSSSGAKSVTVSEAQPQGAQPEAAADRPAVSPAQIDAARLAQFGWRERDIPACLSCHGPQARADYPRLQGQNRYYLQQQLLLFAELGHERGGSQAHVMAPIAAALTPEMIEALSAYLSQEPTRD